jgi:hypothetical protein
LPEQFLGGAAHADAAVNAEFGHRQLSLLHRFISRANERAKQGTTADMEDFIAGYRCFRAGTWRNERARFDALCSHPRYSNKLTSG